jgi:hypothetical protein
MPNLIVAFIRARLYRTKVALQVVFFSLLQ